MSRPEILSELRTWIRDIGLPTVLLLWILFRLDVSLNTWLPILTRTQYKLDDIHTTIRRCCPLGNCPICPRKEPDAWQIPGTRSPPSPAHWAP